MEGHKLKSSNGSDMRWEANLITSESNGKEKGELYVNRIQPQYSNSATLVLCKRERWDPQVETRRTKLILYYGKISYYYIIIVSRA
jgi:hypothetical protein